MSEIERIQKDLKEKYTSKRFNNSKGQHIQMLDDIKYLNDLAKNNEVLDLVSDCECDGEQDLKAGTGECRKCGGQCTY